MRNDTKCMLMFDDDIYYRIESDKNYWIYGVMCLPFSPSRLSSYQMVLHVSGTGTLLC